jgi:hypothetical protein
LTCPSVVLLYEDSAMSQLWLMKKCPSPDSDSASTLFLTFHASRTVRNKFFVYKPPSLWYLVLATQASHGKSKSKWTELFLQYRCEYKVSQVPQWHSPELTRGTRQVPMNKSKVVS